MKYLYKDLLYASLESGQGYDKMINGTKEDKTKNYDFSSTLNEKYWIIISIKLYLH